LEAALFLKSAIQGKASESFSSLSGVRRFSAAFVFLVAAR
jgi:hypothetical protein